MVLNCNWLRASESCCSLNMQTTGVPSDLLRVPSGIMPLQRESVMAAGRDKVLLMWTCHSLSNGVMTSVLHRFVGGLSGFHCFLTSQNSTTYEHFRHRHANQSNPYNVSCPSNWFQVLTAP